MQHPYYPQQPPQQQSDAFYFYQPQHDSSQALPYDHTTTTTTTVIPKNNTNNNNNNTTTTTHFYNSADDYTHHHHHHSNSNSNNNNTYEQPLQQSPLVTVGVATPPAQHDLNNNSNNLSVSPKQFGVDSNSQSSPGSPSHKYQQQQQQQQQQRMHKVSSNVSSSFNNNNSNSNSNTLLQQQQQQQQYNYHQQQPPSAFRPLFQPPPQPQSQLQFQQFQSQSQLQSQLQRAPSPPVFRDHVPTVPQPQFHSQVYQQQQQLNQQQQQINQQGSSNVSTPSLLPPLLRGGFISYLLNIILPQDEMDVNPANNTASAESVPLHRIRFGYPEDDIPLLQELGIFPHHIRSKALAVLNPFKSMSQEVVEDTDLAGPVVFAITLAFLLSLRGKLQFSTIYSHSVLGIIFTKVLLTLMTDHGVSLQFVISALGYCLIPSVVLAGFQSLLYLLFGYIGKTLLLPALLIVLWSAWCATSMLVNGLSMERQRYLIMYPIFLFYAVFAALTIF